MLTLTSFLFLPHLPHSPTMWLKPSVYNATSTGSFAMNSSDAYTQLLHFSKHVHSCQLLRLSEKPCEVCCSGPVRWPGWPTSRISTLAIQIHHDHPELGLFVLFTLCVDYHDLFFFFKSVSLTQSFLTLVHIICPVIQKKNHFGVILLSTMVLHHLLGKGQSS